jgi:hypothetical protein
MARCGKGRNGRPRRGWRANAHLVRHCRQWKTRENRRQKELHPLVPYVMYSQFVSGCNHERCLGPRAHPERRMPILPFAVEQNAARAHAISAKFASGLFDPCRSALRHAAGGRRGVDNPVAVRLSAIAGAAIRRERASMVATAPQADARGGGIGPSARRRLGERTVR